MFGKVCQPAIAGNQALTLKKKCDDIECRPPGDDFEKSDIDSAEAEIEKSSRIDIVPFYFVETSRKKGRVSGCFLKANSPKTPRFFFNLGPAVGHCFCTL